MKEETKRIHIDEALLLTDGNEGKIYVSRHEVRKRQNIGVVIRRIDILEETGAVLKIHEPRPLRPIKEKAPQRLAMVELVYLRLPIFSSEAVLVLAHDEGKRIRHVAGDVVAPRRRCQTGLVETTDNEMRRSSKSCAGTDVETKRLCIKAVVEIMEDLVERIHSQ